MCRRGRRRGCVGAGGGGMCRRGGREGMCRRGGRRGCVGAGGGGDV